MLVAVTLLVGVWALTASREAGTRTWIHNAGTAPGPVRILQFYANVGTIKAGEKAQLCYGVENARSVLISPPVAGTAPVSKRCVEIVPLHTTHYTILAEGFDGRVVVKSFTLAVDRSTAGPSRHLLYALTEEPYFTATGFSAPFSRMRS
jgi:hypothetical protein